MVYTRFSSNVRISEDFDLTFIHNLKNHDNVFGFRGKIGPNTPCFSLELVINSVVCVSLIPTTFKVADDVDSWLPGPD